MTTLLWIFFAIAVFGLGGLMTVTLIIQAALERIEKLEESLAVLRAKEGT
jgi:hypothetical protein